MPAMHLISVDSRRRCRRQGPSPRPSRTSSRPQRAPEPRPNDFDISRISRIGVSLIGSSYHGGGAGSASTVAESFRPLAVLRELAGADVPSSGILSEEDLVVRLRHPGRRQKHDGTVAHAVVRCAVCLHRRALDHRDRHCRCSRQPVRDGLVDGAALPTGEDVLQAPGVASCP